jgi:serine/threonine protein phosphatase 1
MSQLPLTCQDGHRIFVHAGIRPGVPLDRQRAEDLLWIRRSFLDHPGPFPKYVVHGHSPTLRLPGASRTPHVLLHRCNLDTGAVYGGPLSAAVFSDEQAAPIAILTTDSETDRP